MSTATNTEIIRCVLLIVEVFAWQMLTIRNDVLLAVTPDYTAADFSFGTDDVEVLKQPYAKRHFARNACSVHYTRERMLEFKIVTHGWSEYDSALSLTHPPNLYRNGTDVLSPNRRQLKNEFLCSLSSGSVI